MQLHPYVAQVQEHLRAAAALGDDRTRQTADALAAAAEPALRLAVLAAVSAAADEITAALLDSPGSPTVAVSLDADELRVEVRSTAEAEPEPAAAPEDTDASARISMRLSEALKADIDEAARSMAVSVNTWLVRAAANAVNNTHRGGQNRGNADTGRNAGRNQHRVTGWING